VITSIADNMGIRGLTAYSATKAVVRSFVRTGTAELKDPLIRVNAISPGPIDAPMVSAEIELACREKQSHFETAFIHLPRQKLVAPQATYMKRIIVG
jgi:NAD(P)-dependent dehydrogenase (short-subunit alcohol dehydrogenase family)